MGFGHNSKHNSFYQTAFGNSIEEHQWLVWLDHKKMHYVSPDYDPGKWLDFP